MQSYAEQVLSPAIVATCYIIGVIIKRYVTKIPNRYIPLINGALGIVLACAMHQDFTMMVIIEGLVSGWASTGLFETRRNLISEEVSNG